MVGHGGVRLREMQHVTHMNGDDVGTVTSEVLKNPQISLSEPIRRSRGAPELPEKSQRGTRKAFGGDFICTGGSWGAYGFHLTP